MAMNHLLSYDHDHDDDDYIDMEVSSYSSFLSISSPQFPKEFEFQMSTAPIEKDTTTSPADELFYKGKLLPLHLPPRLQMVDKILEKSNSAYNHRKETFEECFSTPLMTTATTPTSTSTPFESCNISPSDSCCVSRELNPEEYFFEYSSEIGGFICENPKKSWIKKLKLIKQSSLGSKLKASRAYFKSLFGKSAGCSDDSCTVATNVADEVTVSEAKESLNKYVKPSNKTPFGQIQNDKYQISTTAMQNKQKITGDGSGGLHRRSFSMAIKRYSKNKSLSSSSSDSSSPSLSSTNSNGAHRLPFLKRSSSAKSEIENPIQGAIAHCKQSQQLFHSRKTVNEAKLYSISATRISLCDEQERPVHCRG